MTSREDSANSHNQRKVGEPTVHGWVCDITSAIIESRELIVYWKVDGLHDFGSSHCYATIICGSNLICRHLGMRISSQYLCRPDLLSLLNNDGLVCQC